MIFPKTNPVLLVTALSFESRAIRLAQPTWKTISRLLPIRGFHHAQLPLYLIEVGMGFQLSVHRFREILQQLRPRWLINFGISGSLTPQSTWGQTYQIQRIHARWRAHPLDIAIEPALQAIFPPATLFTSQQPVRTAAERDFYHHQTDAELVDMEAYTIIEIARSLAPRVLVLKTVSDFADESSLHLVKKRRSALQRRLTQDAAALIGFLFPEGKESRIPAISE